MVTAQCKEIRNSPEHLPTGRYLTHDCACSLISINSVGASSTNTNVVEEGRRGEERSIPHTTTCSIILSYEFRSEWRSDAVGSGQSEPESGIVKEGREESPSPFYQYSNEDIECVRIGEEFNIKVINFFNHVSATPTVPHGAGKPLIDRLVLA